MMKLEQKLCAAFDDLDNAIAMQELRTQELLAPSVVEATDKAREYTPHQSPPEVRLYREAGLVGERFRSCGALVAQTREAIQSDPLLEDTLADLYFRYNRYGHHTQLSLCSMILMVLASHEKRSERSTDILNLVLDGSSHRSSEIDKAFIADYLGKTRQARAIREKVEAELLGSVR